MAVRFPLALAALALVAAGCATNSPGEGGLAEDLGQQPGSLHAICAAEAVTAEVGTGICTQVLAPGQEREREASIAAHATEPGTVLVTWRNGEFRDGPTIGAAFTRDGGAHWDFSTLHDPSLEDLPMGSRYAFDSVARFGPDGTGYVLYGGEYRHIRAGDAAQVIVEFRMTLASTRNGVAWTYHTLDDLPGTFVGPDHMDLAVAPDSGRLIVVAQMLAGPPVNAFCPTACPVVNGAGASEGIWAWTSDDEGATWSIPVLAAPAEAFGAARPIHVAPRLAAGPEGLVLLTTQMRLALGPAVANGDKVHGAVTISRDTGDSWEEPQSMFVYAASDGMASGDTELNSPAAVWKDSAGLHAALVYGDAGNVTGLRSDDAGATWSDPVPLATYPPGMSHVWLRAEAREGEVWAAYRWGSDDPARFGASILRWTGAGVQNLTVADWPVPGAWKIGDDYGAVAVAADGTAWMAFSDGENGGERVRVAHVGD